MHLRGKQEEKKKYEKSGRDNGTDGKKTETT